MVTSSISHFNAGKVIMQDDIHIIYEQEHSGGKAIAAVYPVFPGIEVIELQLKGNRFIPVLHEDANIMEINYCFKGCIECKTKDGRFQYVSDGDLTLSSLNNHSSSLELPLKNYLGIAVIINMASAKAAILNSFQYIKIGIDLIYSRFFSENEFFLIQANEPLKHLFSTIQDIPEEAKADLFRIKVQELLLYLHYFEPALEKQKNVYARQQVDIIKQIHNKITSEYDCHYTIAQLALQYGISPTVLKNTFKGVYGISLAAYMKQYRMRKAASLLMDSKLNIAEVAEKTGYKSQSKFSAAFKESMKITPFEFRQKKLHSGSTDIY